MATPINIEFDVVPSDPENPLAFCVELDGEKVWHSESVTSVEHVVLTLDDDIAGEHCLRWILSGKQPHHTVIDGDSNIVRDSLITVSNVILDGIVIDAPLLTVCKYSHDFNGTGQPVTETFYGAMGCNGTVEMTFSSPLYLWLLENM